MHNLTSPVQITWLRHTGATAQGQAMPDLLTVGKTTYTGDTRIKSSFSYPNNWRLEMVDMQTKDSGLYICQISSHPPVGLHTRIRVSGEQLVGLRYPMKFAFNSLSKTNHQISARFGGYLILFNSYKFFDFCSEIMQVNIL